MYYQERCVLSPQAGMTKGLEEHLHEDLNYCEVFYKKKFPFPHN